jgi:hypothetical protein
MTQEQERARDRARKVFQLGASTTAQGEKEKAVAVLMGLCHQHQLVLYDLNVQFPKRLDLALLRAKIGLAPASAGESRVTQSPQQPNDPATRRGANAPGSTASTASGSGQANADVQNALFRNQSPAERQRQLQGPMFSQGMLRPMRHTTTYTRLLTELHSLNSSNVGVGLSDTALVGWYEKVLSQPGSCVPCKSTSKTIFDDLAAYCRAQYLAETEQQRQDTQRRKADEGRRRAEAAKQEQERSMADQRRREEEARKTRARQAADERRAAGSGKSSDVHGQSPGPTTFTQVFEHQAEAELYLKVAQRRVGPEGNLKSFREQERFYVEFGGSAALHESVEVTYRQTLYDLQMAVSTIRAEAGRAREEAIRQAEAAYVQQCKQALQAAVDGYTA